MKNRYVSIVSATIVGLTLTACGGSSHKPSAGTTSTTQSTTTTQTTVTHRPPRVVLTEEARVSKGNPQFSSLLKVSPNQKVQLRTVVPKPKHGTVPVTLTFSRGPAKTLTVTATSRGKHSSVKLQSAKGSPVSLLDISYSCDLPPLPSSCPPRAMSGSQSVSKVKLATTIPIVMTASVGPLSAPARKLRPTSPSVVAPYTITEQVVFFTPGSASRSTPASTATVKPGQTVVLITHVHGKLAGAPQSLSLVINQGPSKSLTISASVPGGATSTATVTGAGGKRIALIAPRYACLLPPDSTFCPMKATVQSRRYTLGISVTPNTPAVVVAAKVLAG